MNSRYNKFSDYLQNRFGGKVWKICLDASLPCPNKLKDGTGCLFCRNDSFAPYYKSSLSIPEQMTLGIEKAKKKGVGQYIAYFQAGTNTFSSPEILRRLFFSAITFEGVVGLSIATRPDCIAGEVVNLFRELSQLTNLWIELGLQSSNNEILKKIRRGHTVEDYIQAVKFLVCINARICTHLMFGLPGETPQDVHDCARLITEVGSHEVKIHPLLILKDTAFGEFFEKGNVTALNLEEYVGRVCDFLERIPADRVIQRLTAEAPRNMLLAPVWALQKSVVLNAVEKEFERRGTRQSALWG